MIIKMKKEHGCALAEPLKASNQGSFISEGACVVIFLKSIGITITMEMSYIPVTLFGLQLGGGITLVLFLNLSMLL